MLLKVSRIIISIIILSLSSYGMYTKNFEILPFMMLFSGGLMLVMGLEKLQKNRKSYMGYSLIVASLLGFLVSIQGFIFN